MVLLKKMSHFEGTVHIGVILLKKDRAMVEIGRCKMADGIIKKDEPF